MLTFATACGGGKEAGSPSPSASPGPSPTPGFATARGFVLASFGFVFPETPADACPGGFNRGPIERQADGDPPLPDDCLDPQAHSDPEFRTLDAPGTLDGLDVDGTVSSSSDGTQCAHDDFVTPTARPASTTSSGARSAASAAFRTATSSAAWSTARSATAR